MSIPIGLYWGNGRKKCVQSHKTCRDIRGKLEGAEEGELRVQVFLCSREKLAFEPMHRVQVRVSNLAQNR